MAFPFLGCPHNHLSFPMVIPPGTAQPRRHSSPPRSPDDTAAHVTCLDCGREFWYDWAKMRRLGARPQPVYQPRRAA